MPPKGSKRAKAAETMDAHSLQAAWSEYCVEPEPGLATQIAALQSELADVRALFARASNLDTAFALYHDLIDQFDQSGCRYRCPVTDNWLWRGYMSLDDCMAVKVCIGTLRDKVKLEYNDEPPFVLMKRLRLQNSCKEGAQLMEEYWPRM